MFGFPRTPLRLSVLLALQERAHREARCAGVGGDDDSASSAFSDNPIHSSELPSGEEGDHPASEQDDAMMEVSGEEELSRDGRGGGERERGSEGGYEGPKRVAEEELLFEEPELIKTGYKYQGHDIIELYDSAPLLSSGGYVLNSKS